MASDDMQVGVQSLGDGARSYPRGDKTGAQVVTDLHGKFYEQTARNNVYFLDSGAVTLAAAHVTGGALGTIKFVNGFYNPATSGVNASILAVVIGCQSTAAIFQPFVYNYFVGKVPTNAATGTIRNARLIATGAGQSAMSPQANVVLAVLAADTTTVGTQAGVVAGNYSAPTTQAATIFDPVEGRLVVPPGTLFGFCSSVSNVNVVQSTIWWEEVGV